MVIYVIIKQDNGSIKPAKLKRELYFFSSFTRSRIDTKEFYNNLDIVTLYSKLPTQI